jgi:Brp/Blh family beta-carotene 15,15'-monooxygenase
LLLTAILLGLSLLPGLDRGYSLGVFITLIALTGLPHGATDHYLAWAQKRQRGQAFAEGRFVLQYLLQVLLYGLAWYFLPLFSLVLFLGISAYHFGQAQLFYVGLQARNRWLAGAAYTLWGGAVLAFLIFLNGPQSWAILSALFPAGPLGEAIQAALHHEGEAIAGVAGVLCSLLLASLMIAGRLRWWRGLLELTVLALLAGLSYWCDLFLSFGIFFGLWHAGKSIQALLGYFQAEFGAFNLQRFYRIALKYSLISFAGIGLLLAAHAWLDAQLNLVLVFFIFISAVTLPHMRLIDRVYSADTVA